MSFYYFFRVQCHHISLLVHPIEILKVDGVVN